MEPVEPAPDLLDRPLGAARAQVHDTYIVAQTRDGLVIVDQHAAHERLVYERMKAALEATGVARQILLIPEVVELDSADVERLLARTDELKRFGLAIEPFGHGRMEFLYVVVFAAVFSKKASRRRAALAVLGLLIARLKPFGRRLPPED